MSAAANRSPFNPDAPSIAGGWLGTYAYRGADAYRGAMRFEATFTPGKTPNDPFGGSILDDGPLGEARIENGSQTGRRVRFSKRYVQPSAPRGNAAPPVDYEGTLSEDGRQMAGTWQLVSSTGGGHGSRRPVRRTTHGVWEAHRMWSAEAEPETRVEADALAGTQTLAPVGGGPA